MLLVKPSHQIVTEVNGEYILRRIEEAGRTCYKSESAITADSARRFVYLLIKKGHLSVIEHESISVRIICDRGVTHEIVRHRLASYSQESTRYCNYEGGVTFIIPPWIDISDQEIDSSRFVADFKSFSNASGLWILAMARVELDYISLIAYGWTPQKARSVLPNSLKTEIVVTANIREWRHIFSLRCAVTAHPQMREVMIPIREEFKKRIPVLFDDL